MSDENFDMELERQREFMEGLIRKQMEELEKQTLLRTRGNLHYRLCSVAGGNNPPITQLETMWHRINHGEGVPGFGKPRDWSDLERIDAELAKRQAGR
jgi:hypothetical protein